MFGKTQVLFIVSIIVMSRDDVQQFHPLKRRSGRGCRDLDVGCTCFFGCGMSMYRALIAVNNLSNNMSNINRTTTHCFLHCSQDYLMGIRLTIAVPCMRWNRDLSGTCDSTCVLTPRCSYLSHPVPSEHQRKRHDGTRFGAPGPLWMTLNRLFAPLDHGRL